MHFVSVDNLRSSWREFLAIHELGCNIPLLSEILGSSRSMEMCHTPPIHSCEDDESFNSSSPTVGGVRKAVDPRLAVKQRAAASRAAKESSENASLSSASTLSQKARAPIEQEVAEWRMHGVTDKFMKYLRIKFNPSQLHAIRTAATQMGFTLVQGPPGTGKTSTIIGMLNSIHIREYNRYYELALSTVLGPAGQSCRASNSEAAWLSMVSQLSKTKPHILVVAPSNVAVDNIIERIMELGFYDGNGGRYNPSMLRVGGGKTPRVQSVSLEDTMRAEEGMMRTSKHSDRVAFVDGLSQQIGQLIRDVYFHQSLLFNLKTAFDAHYPLPEGWELRVSTKSGIPYWVDHIQRKTSSAPPPIVKQEAGKEMRARYRKIEHLPEYLLHSHRLTQLLDQLDACNLKRTRLQAIISSSQNRFSSGTAVLSGSNSQQSPGALGKEMLESSIIDGAQLLFTTLNSSGHPSMEATEFCVTLIDEAAQCVEPSVLIALRRGCKQCIMVGDQKQLSATTFSNSVKAVGYDKSLFERLVESGHPYIMLDTQYRMAPSISDFPSAEFYGGKLRDGANVTGAGYLPHYIKPNCTHTEETTNTADSSATIAPILSKFDALTAAYHPAEDSAAAPPLFSSFMFLDLLTSREEDPDSPSKANLQEVALCVGLLRALIAEAARCGAKLGSVGVITPYGEQLGELRKALTKAGLMQPKESTDTSKKEVANGAEGSGAAATNSSSNSSGCEYDVECNTVDGFQGREKDLILISTVRANDQESIGFLSDTRRMNVALTRGKFGMFVVGHAGTLSRNRHWGDLLEHAHRCEGYVEVPDAETDLRALLRAKVQLDEQSKQYRDREQQLQMDPQQRGSGGDRESSAYPFNYPQQNIGQFAQPMSSNCQVPPFRSSAVSSFSTVTAVDYSSAAAPVVKRRRVEKTGNNISTAVGVLGDLGVEEGEICE